MATMEDKRKDLTSVQKKFADEYLLDPSDGGAAYMRASGSTNKKSSSVQASKLLKLPKMQEYLKDQAKSYLGVMEARILQNVEFWLGLRDGNLPGESREPTVSKRELIELLDTFGAGKELMEAVNELFVYLHSTIKVADRMKASENLGKYMQMFVEKKEVSVEGQVRIVDDI